MKNRAKACSWFLGTAILLLSGTSKVRGDSLVFPNDSSVLNLKSDFGAVGDGVHNDTAALQNGLNSAQGSNGTYRVLFIPNGTYVVTNTLVVYGAVGPWVYGESQTGAVIKLADEITQSPYNR